MIETLDGQESDTDPTEEPRPVQKNKKSKNPNVRKRQPYGGEENLFLSMPEYTMHKNDSDIDKKLKPKEPVVKRSRKASVADVKCRVCGREETVSTQLIVDGVHRYKCNVCARGAG